MSDTVVLFEGAKTFWKTRDFLKIVIVHHLRFSCLEIISYDPSVGVEYPRIYLDVGMIGTKLDPEIIQETYVTKREILNRKKKISKGQDELLNEIQMHMTMQYA